MITVIQIRNAKDFKLFYSSHGFNEGLDVTGYLIYPDTSKSSVLHFLELGDGIYVTAVPYERKTKEFDEKYGVVIKENGETKHFDFIRIVN